MTVHDLVDAYLRNGESIGRAAKTLEDYRGLYSNYIAPSDDSKMLAQPYLGAILVSKLRPAHVSAWIDALLTKGGGRRKNPTTGKAIYKPRPLSAKTVKHAFTLLSSALGWGVQMELAARNVCDAVTAPSPTRPEARSFTNNEISRLVKAAVGTRWEHFLVLALSIGARRGELLGVSWPDVDLEGRQLTIRASLSQVTGRVFLKGTKTEKVRVGSPLSRSSRRTAQAARHAGG